MQLEASCVAKREAVVKRHKNTELYVMYKTAKTAEMPDTPRPTSHESKRSWEASMYQRRAAMRSVQEKMKDSVELI